MDRKASLALFRKGLERVLPKAEALDYLVSTLPDMPATVGLLDSRIFSAMKPESILINVGRGNVLDEAALLDAVSN